MFHCDQTKDEEGSRIGKQFHFNTNNLLVDLLKNVLISKNQNRLNHFMKKLPTAGFMTHEFQLAALTKHGQSSGQSLEK